MLSPRRQFRVMVWDGVTPCKRALQHPVPQYNSRCPSGLHRKIGGFNNLSPYTRLIF
ncbi:Protein of unknown function [Pyronema omphalodes CBS 100304]|uniref:Uncharacterized protein n=1 Tax=Pyronema omphalodes (strain CBS 100304) TaxID=1076935 RepID=U4LGT2_PYROM|nr:Protein of unknown function [Pyronema omphalodes CBS 100304]